jgi:CubicO group peptidase (beta-lactamase class C family)
MLELSYTDGIIVLHRRKLIYERYLNGMQAHTHHAWASGSKSMTGTLAAMLAYEGLFDPDTLITVYLPELKGSGFAGATIHQAMDMTTGVKFNEDEPDPLNESRAMVENWKYSVTMGWRAKPAGDDETRRPAWRTFYLPNAKHRHPRMDHQALTG